MSRSAIEAHFPALVGTGYEVTSPETASYNCIAWAAGDDTRWWQPLPIGGYYWPDGVARANTLDAYIHAFRRQGYRVCDDGALEAGWEKVALFQSADGVPTHAARQLPSGVWASKLGQGHDIEHVLPQDVSGAIYGTIALFMRRRGRANMPPPQVRNVV